MTSINFTIRTDETADEDYQQILGAAIIIPPPLNTIWSPPAYLFGDQYYEYYEDLEERVLNSVIEASAEEYRCFEKKNQVIVGITPSVYSSVKDTAKSNSCSICQIDYELEDSVMILKCDHIFHQTCVQEWAMYKPECPLCKSEIDVNECGENNPDQRT